MTTITARTEQAAAAAADRLPSLRAAIAWLSRRYRAAHAARFEPAPDDGIDVCIVKVPKFQSGSVAKDERVPVVMGDKHAIGADIAAAMRWLRDNLDHAELAVGAVSPSARPALLRALGAIDRRSDARDRRRDFWLHVLEHRPTLIDELSRTPSQPRMVATMSANWTRPDTPTLPTTLADAAKIWKYRDHRSWRRNLVDTGKVKAEMRGRRIVLDIHQVEHESEAAAERLRAE